MRHRHKNVSRAFFEVEADDGHELQVGESLDALTGAVPDDEGVVEVRIQETWNRGGRVLLRSDLPLPLTVYAATREVAFGGT